MFNQQTTRDEYPLSQGVTSWHLSNQTENKQQASTKTQPNLSSTPISKGNNTFKSPAPSNRKLLNLNGNKSPMPSNLTRVNGSNSK